MGKPASLGSISKGEFREIQEEASSEHGSDNVLESALRRRLFGRSTIAEREALLNRLDIEIEILKTCKRLVKERR